MSAQCINQTLFSELFSRSVERFSDAIRVERKHVTRGNPAFSHGTSPVFKETKHRTRGFESLHSFAATKEQSREVAAVGITETASAIIVVAKEETGISISGCILIEELIH